MIAATNGLKYKLLPALLESNNEAIKTFVVRDLLEEKVSMEELWQLPEPKKILKKQKLNGSWEYASKKVSGKKENYDQYVTFKKLGILVEKFGFNKTHSAIQKTADYFFSVQTKEGDFRGIYDKQYTPNYTAGITELLIKAGYENDLRIDKVFQWLLSSRQEDGGWALPYRTRNHNNNVIHVYPKTIQPDKSKKSSPMVTGVVLRAFAAHPTYKNSEETKQSGQLVTANFFKNEPYPDRKASEYWERFIFPFCYTDLISALDSLSLLGFSKNDPQIEKGLTYFINSQQKNGLWQFNKVLSKDKDDAQLWLSLALGRIFKRFYKKIYSN